MFIFTDAELKEYYARFRVTPVCKRVLFDTETPLSLYAKTAAQEEDSFLLESVESEHKIGRYSFIGFNAHLKVTLRDFKLSIIQANNPEALDQITLSGAKDLFSSLRALLKKYTAPSHEALPPFFSGLIGFAGYDMISYLEPVPRHNNRTLEFPEMEFIMPRIVICVDHATRSAAIICNIINDGKGIPFEEQYEKALQEIAIIEERMKKPCPLPLLDISETKVDMPEAETIREDFMAAVNKAKEYIRAGDIIQVVLSQRFKIPINKQDLNIYRHLRCINPSPYMFYVRMGARRLIGSSPEALIRNTDGLVMTRPIAGTRKRGTSGDMDAEIQRELLADPKERAEHVMLVDLGRNDLGRVCEAGSIKVSQFMNVEKYSHVMHIVSQVEGRIKQGLDSFDVFASAFPAGTVSGAPKVRAMQIIRELEPSHRGPYAGAVGYFSCNGDMDMAIAIRTIMIDENMAFVQAGAGIVADSNDESEYAETVNKAKALLKAIAMSEAAG